MRRGARGYRKGEEEETERGRKGRINGEGEVEGVRKKTQRKANGKEEKEKERKENKTKKRKEMKRRLKPRNP